MKLSFLSFLLFLLPLSAKLPTCEVSIGAGVQHDQAKVFDARYFRLWTTYVRAEAGLGWNNLLATYQTDFSGSKLWNQRALLQYDLSFLCLHLLPTVGWNRFENRWKLGRSTPSALGNLNFSLGSNRGDFVECFNGGCLGGDLLFALGPLQAKAGYRYTFGHFSSHIKKDVQPQRFSSTGDGQIGILSLEWWFLPLLSAYVEGEGRWIQNRGKEALPIRWDSYDITVGARVTF